MRLLACAAALVLMAGVARAAVWDLGVTRTSAAKVPVGILGVVEAEGQSGLDDPVEEARRVLMADLRRSGVFRARDLELHVAQEPDKVLSPMRIRDIGVRETVDVLLWLQVGKERGRTVLTGHVYDGSRGTRVDGRRYVGDDDQLRRMVHRFVGELIHRYTGEYGITHSRIAFVSDITGKKEINVMDYDGYAPVRVTSDRSISLMPALSPDGKRVLYVSQKSGQWRLYEVDLATGDRTAAPLIGSTVVSPSWEPGGDGYAVAANVNGNQELFHVRKSGHVDQLTHDGADDVSPTYSPDGKRVAFTSNRGGSPQIYVMDAHGGRARRITFDGPYNSEPSWSPTGLFIAFTCQQGDHFKICLAEAGGGDSTAITSGPWDDESPVFSPDGRHIAFASNRGGRQDIYMMDVDGRNVERLTYNGANNMAPSWADTESR
jgi:TolB protein